LPRLNFGMIGRTSRLSILSIIPMTQEHPMLANYTFRTAIQIACSIVCINLLAPIARGDGRPDISRDLKDGHLAAAEESLTRYLAGQPMDDVARFQLGGVEFFAAIEGLAQDSYRYGLRPNAGMVPFLRTPIKTNPHPQTVTYNDVRKMIERFVAKVEH